MISIIICARKNDIANELKQNIRNTIGAPYEIIVIDNSENKYNIFAAYNIGVRQSNHPILLFMHDDIFCHTDGWGPLVIDHFKDELVGAIGIAGTPYLPLMPGAWWSTGVGYLHLLQSKKDSAEPVLENFFPQNTVVADAVALDGVWFCIRRKLFEKIQFDDITFKGFHLYDADITAQVYLAGYRVLCVKNILIHHLSIGVLDEKWIENLLLFNNKWKDQLPIACKEFRLSQQCHMEYRVLNEFISNQVQNRTKTKQKERSVYFFALKKLISFRKGLLYYKTPLWAAKLFVRYLKNL